MTALRRARPMLGTLVEIGVQDPHASQQCLSAAFAAVEDVQAQLSRFDAHSDIARFHATQAGETIELRHHAAVVLAAAHALHEASGGLFDVSLGSGPTAWHIEGTTLTKRSEAVQLDLGGIAKGHAVDHAVEVLTACGCVAGWVNAGGDLRVFGELDLPLDLRDEHHGGVRRFGMLRDGAFATSHFDPASRSRAAAPRRVCAHASVAAPRCLWADALTKVVAISGDARHPLLAHCEAIAWLH